MAKQASFAQAVKWSFTANWGERAFSTLFTFLLASLLGPGAFGVASIAMVYVAFLGMFLDQGLTTALIHPRDVEPDHFDAVFWTNLVLSFGLAGITVALSSWWAKANHLPQLAAVIAVLSIATPLEGLACVHRAILQRNMDFRGLSLRANASVIVGGAVGLAMAFRGFGVWALVFQTLSRDFTAMLLLWTLSHWRPRLRFSFRHLKDLLGFSTGHFTAQLATFADTQAAGILMGLFFGPVAVGLYRLAAKFQGTVQAAATSSVQAVSLPEFSRLQHRPAELRQSVLSCIWLSCVITVPALAGLGAVSSPLISLIGPAWAPAAGVLQILCLAGIALTFVFFTGPLLQALGRPGSMAMLEWARAALGAVVLSITGVLLRHSSVNRQVMGIALSTLITTAVIVAPVYLFVLARFADLSFKEIRLLVAPSLVAAGAIVVAEMAISAIRLLSKQEPFVVLGVDVVLGAIVGAGILVFLDSRLNNALRGFLGNLHPASQPITELPSK